MKGNNTKSYLLLHVMLMVYSLSGVFSKMASGEPWFSFRFCVYYGIVILLLVLYAIGWQQIIKKLPLTTAFANKAITVIWGIIWGYIFFREGITTGKIVGALIVMCGVVLFAFSGDRGNVDE